MTNATDRSHDHDSTAVRVSKVYTHNGERLEISGGSHSTRIDALELESVTWQDRETLGDLVAAADRPEGELSTIRSELSEDPTTIRNEYGVVTLRVTDDGEGHRLHVSAPKLGYQAALSAGELYALAQQPRETFSEFLETPFGPDAEEPDIDFH